MINKRAILLKKKFGYGRTLTILGTHEKIDFLRTESGIAVGVKKGEWIFNLMMFL
jgi:hypothetical protein